MLRIGDIVRFLNDVGGGRIVGFSGSNTALVEDGDGFEIPMRVNECVVVESAGSNKTQGGITLENKRKEDPFGVTNSEKIFEKEIQTRDGEKIELSLAYVLTNPNNIDSSDFDIYLINESNYSIYFQYLTKDDSGKYSLRYGNNTPPYSREKLFRFSRNLINNIQRKFIVKAIPFKEGKTFVNKPIYEVELNLDTKLLLKQSSYKENKSIDIPAYLISIVKEDEISYFNMEESLKKLTTLQIKEQFNKEKGDQPNKKATIKQSLPTILEIDLHAHEILETTTGMSNTDIILYQLDFFNKTISQYYEKKRGQKIVFIHGKGDGVLRQAILKELKLKYPKAKYQDASFKEYGFGATMVIL